MWRPLRRVRSAHGWKPGHEFVVEETGDGIKPKPLTPYPELLISSLVFRHEFTARFGLRSVSYAPTRRSRRKDRKGILVLTFWWEARKLKNKPFGQRSSNPFWFYDAYDFFFYLRRIVLYVCRPLNGQHKITFLCELCGSAVNKKINHNIRCLNNW